MSTTPRLVVQPEPQDRVPFRYLALVSLLRSHQGQGTSLPPKDVGVVADMVVDLAQQVERLRTMRLCAVRGDEVVQIRCESCGSVS